MEGWFIILIGVVLLFGIFWISFETKSSKIDYERNPSESKSSGNIGETKIDWRNIELKNVQDNSNYKISELSDNPVLIESFAVWCPTCTKQQNQIKELHEDIEFGDKFYSITLDTDPNEEEGKVLEHARSNGFTWRYSVSPSDLTNALIDEFGISVVNAPSAPVILICQGAQESHFLEKGVKTSEELKKSIETKCGLS